VTPTPTETLPIGRPPGGGLALDIHPIQVVQDPPDERAEEIPLVRDKATMVRVFVLGDLPDGTVIRDVEAQLQTGEGVMAQITADLHFNKKRAQVVPHADRQLFISGSAAAQARSALLYDAYNFEFPNGHGAGTFGVLPRQDPFTVTVHLVRGNEPLGSLAEGFPLRSFTDTDGNGRRRLSFHFVETADRMLRDRPGTPAADAALSSLARQQIDGLIALFPVPHTQVEMVVDLGGVHMLPGTAPAEVSTFLSRFFLAALGADVLVDRFVLVVPGPTVDRRSVAGDIYVAAGGTALDDAGGLAPRDVRGTVFIVESPNRFTTAHEDGHQLGLGYRGADPDHNDGPAADGWEVRRTLPSPFRKLVSEPHISFMRGPLSVGVLFGSLWAARDDYEQLLQTLTAGGSGGGGWAAAGGGAALSPPLAVFIAGHRELDGTIQLAPFFTSNSVPDDIPPGDLTARAVALDGSVLAQRSFGLDTESIDDPGNIFGFHLPFRLQPVIERERDIFGKGIVETMDGRDPLAQVALVETQQDRLDHRQVFARAGGNDAVGSRIDAELHPHRTAATQPAARGVCLRFRGNGEE